MHRRWNKCFYAGSIATSSNNAPKQIQQEGAVSRTTLPDACGKFARNQISILGCVEDEEIEQKSLQQKSKVLALYFEMR